MLKWIIRNRIAAFERTYNYDMAYARELLAIDTSAFMAFAKVSAMSNYRKDVPREVRLAVALVGTLAEDCGPCTQLGVTLGLREGIDPKVISAIVRDDVDAMSADVRLGVAFAKASLAHDIAADEYRDAIVATWGKRALVALAFALTTSRVWPTLKYALGYGKACQRIVVDGTPIPVDRSARAVA